MSSAAPLEYATPAGARRRLAVHVQPPVLLLWISIALLGIDVFILTLPAFAQFYPGSAMSSAKRWAHFALANETWVNSVFAIVTVAASFYFSRSGWAVRLARSIALALLVYHWFFAPDEGAYGRLLWGSC